MDVYYAYAAYFALRNVGHQWFCLAVAILSFIPPVPLTALQKDHSVNRIHSDPFSHVHLSGDTKQTVGNSRGFCCGEAGDKLRVKEQAAQRI